MYFVRSLYRMVNFQAFIHGFLKKYKKSMYISIHAHFTILVLVLVQQLL